MQKRGAEVVNNKGYKYLVRIIGEYVSFSMSDEFVIKTYEVAKAMNPDVKIQIYLWSILVDDPDKFIEELKGQHE